jgi:hypothetical protein
MGAIETLRALQDAAAAAQRDTRRNSRWRLGRRAADDRYWQLATAVRTYAHDHRHRSNLIDEAIQRASAAERPRRPWWRVDVARVQDELHGVLGVGDQVILERLDAGDQPRVDLDLLQVLEDAAERRSPARRSRTGMACT